MVKLRADAAGAGLPHNKEGPVDYCEMTSALEGGYRARKLNCVPKAGIKVAGRYSADMLAERISAVI